MLVRMLCEIASAIETEAREKMFSMKQMPADYTETERIIHKMLTENTGAHILDSGSAYGRHWEGNRLVTDFRKTPAVIVRVESEDWISVVYNVFHYLNNFLEYDKEMDKKFHKFANSDEYRNKPWLVCMKDFVVVNRYHRFGTVNTYNYDNILSQVLQYVIFAEDDDIYENPRVILQTHNGCDVRGGYSTPHVFIVRDIDYFISAQHDIYAYCKGCDNNWFSDDSGYHMYYHGSTADEKPFSKFTIKDVENNKVYCKDCGSEVVFSVTQDY